MHVKAVLALLLLFSIYGTAFSADGWYNSSWQYRRAITLGEARNITRINEPVYATISGTDGKISNCTKELRITDANSTEIPSQVDSDSVSGGTYSCTIVFMANSSALGSNTYYAYYGNPSAAAPNYPSLDSFFSVTSSLLKNSYYNLPTDGYGVYLPSFSSAGSGSYDISMATGRPYCDNLRWELSVTQNGTGYDIGGSSGCTGYSVPWSVGKNGSVFKEVFARLAPTGSASYLWRLRLFPKSRYIEMFADANISAPVNFTRATFNLVPSGHSTAWDQSSSASSSTFYVNTNSSWGTYGSGSVIFGNVRNVTLSASVAGWEGGVGLHDSAAFLYLPSNVLTCAVYPCIAASPSLRLYWTTDYTVAANRITGSMLDSPLSVSVGAPQSFFISTGISPASKTTYPNTNETFSLWLNNNQSIADNFTLSCSGTCYYSENPVAASAGQNKSVSVTITSAGVSGTTNYQITAASAANASNFATASASLTVDATTWRSQWVDAYGNEFRYRTPITVSNNGSALTDYQVPINISSLVYNNSGLVGSWHFSEGAGTRFVDSSGNGNDGTYNGETFNTGTLNNFDWTAASNWTAGRFGSGIKFDGVNDFVDLGLRMDVPAVTVEAWFKANATHEGTVLDNGGGAGLAEASLWAGADGKIKAGRWGCNGGCALSQGTYAPGEWYHAVAVFEPTITRLYVNGVYQGNATGSYPNVRNVNFQWQAGRIQEGGVGMFFNGVIDGVRIYNRALAQQEIQQVYQNNTFLRNGLVGYWRFDEGTGTTAQDTHHIAAQDNRDGAKSGNALSFDGANDYAAVASSASLNPGKFTVAAWIKTGSPADSFIVDKWGSDTGYALWILGSKITLTINYYLNRVSGNTTVTDGAWHYAVATHDGQTMRIYVDGNLDGTLALAQDAVSTAFDLNLGRYRQGNAYYFNGTLDEVRIYNRSLSASEIQALYSAGKLKLDYSDLRFANSSISSIPYWLESDNRAWVKVPYVPNGTSTVYAYYGNPNAASASNGADTFMLFDDFGGSVLDNAKWTSAGSVSVANGAVSITNGASAVSYIKSVPSLTLPVVAEARWVTKTSSQGADHYAGLGINMAATAGSPWNYWFYQNRWGGSGVGDITENPILLPHVVGILVVNSSYSELYRDRIKLNAYSGSSFTTPYVYLWNSYITAGTDSWDWVFVRKYASPEPALLLQQEETGNPALFIGVSPASRTTYPNYNETFSLWVKNNQTSPDTFALSCAGTCSVSPPSLFLTPYQNGSATVTIASANVSGTTAYAITAVSQSNASNSASVSVSLTVDATKWRDQWTDAYNNGFRYRVPVTINNSGGALTDYQVNVTIDTATPIGLGRMRSDCGDIRVTNGTNELPYWIESGCNTTSTKIWARVPYVPAGNSTIYAYYGNANLAGASNGTATFYFFDDFESGNLSAWVPDSGGTMGRDSTYAKSGNYSLKATAALNTAPQFKHALQSGQYAFTSWYYDKGYGSWLMPCQDDVLVYSGATSSSIGMNNLGNCGTGEKNVYDYYTGSAYATTGISRSAGWHRVDFYANGTATNVYLDYAFVASHSMPTMDNIGFYVYYWSSAGTGNAWYDTVQVRKYSAPEPAASAGLPQSKGYRTLVRRCGLKQANATVTAYQGLNVSGSCLSNQYGICTLEISAGMYDLQLRFADNSTAWKNATVFG